MNTRSLPISYGTNVACRRWHDIELVKPAGDRTEAMNQPGGIVLVRTTLRNTEYSGEDSFCSTTVAASVICLKGMMVAKRWLPRVVDAWVDEENQRHHPGMISVDEEFSLVPASEVSGDPGDSGLLKSESYIKHAEGDSYTKHSEFRWFDADEFMPRPTEDQVRACVESLPPPSEIESLRNELDKMRERYHDAELRVSEARGAREDDEEPWIWSDDDTAASVDSLGNMSIVRITGGHLRALLDQRRDDLYGLWTLALALVIRSAVPGQSFVHTANDLCVAISKCKDRRVLSATNHDGRRRSPAEVAESLFGHDFARRILDDCYTDATTHLWGDRPE